MIKLRVWEPPPPPPADMSSNVSMYSNDYRLPHVLTDNTTLAMRTPSQLPPTIRGVGPRP